ncbi:phosphodiesterase [Nocardioides sp. GY 10113]|uniref:phage holin family protein n=1 Tax=Nocardioides sp. GY 10113 TaxID=2569761 RepID=UPI0010A8A17F|nr:phage holin family protein [Nocardioides sp. GY 10113]TIC88848.1 phosphodiesterase [Nocardioides sp. GY 10113]
MRPAFSPMTPWRWRLGDLGRLIVTWATSAVALAVAGTLLPGLHADSPWDWAWAAAAAGAVGALLRPALVYFAALIGWIGVLLVALVGQGVVIQISLWLVPGIGGASFWTSLAAAWMSALVGTFLGWLVTAGTPESLVAALVGTGRGAPPADDGLTGMLFVQLDGVPAPTLQWAMESGLMPTVRRWVGEGSHQVREWLVQLPCTTPASQLGILHGSYDGVPAFRWYDREVGRVVVANRAGDARLIEERVSDGRGLLADDGISVANLFSGDAARSSMVWSRIEVSRGQFETRRALGWFFVRPDGFARSLGRALVEINRERFQARRQRYRQVVPRVERPWSFTGLRAATNGLVRDVALAVVARELMAGRRSIYVDFVDYDEVAHHAGPMRLEALDVLAELDQLVAMLEQIAARAPRPYEIVLLSDHGQVLGQPFEQAHGEDLAEVCRRLMHEDVTWEGRPVESWGRVASIVDDAAGADSLGERAAGSVSRRLSRRADAGAPASSGGQQTGPGGGSAPGESGSVDPVVIGSGSLGLVYAGQNVGFRRRMTLAELDAQWPELVPGLAAHPGVEAVAGVDAAGVPWAIGGAGARNLATGEVDGTDPMAALPEHGPRMLAEALGHDLAPDLYVLGAVDRSTGEVTAFEEMVGSHGGLGGWQDRGVLVAPTRLLGAAASAEARGQIVGAAQLHRVLVDMLEQLGHRTDLPRRSPGDDAERVGASG